MHTSTFVHQVSAAHPLKWWLSSMWWTQCIGSTQVSDLSKQVLFAAQFGDINSETAIIEVISLSFFPHGERSYKVNKTSTSLNRFTTLYDDKIIVFLLWDIFNFNVSFSTDELKRHCYLESSFIVNKKVCQEIWNSSDLSHILQFLTV